MQWTDLSFRLAWRITRRAPAPQSPIASTFHMIAFRWGPVQGLGSYCQEINHVKVSRCSKQEPLLLFAWIRFPIVVLLGLTLGDAWTKSEFSFFFKAVNVAIFQLIYVTINSILNRTSTCEIFYSSSIFAGSVPTCLACRLPRIRKCMYRYF